MRQGDLLDLSRQEFLDYMARGVTTPPDMGRAFADLSSSSSSTAGTHTCKSLYVIETDDHPRDFSAAPQVFGAYWSDTPDAVNRMDN